MNITYGQQTASNNTNEKLYEMIEEACDPEKNIDEQILNTPWF